MSLRLAKSTILCFVVHALATTLFVESAWADLIFMSQTRCISASADWTLASGSDSFTDFTCAPGFGVFNEGISFGIPGPPPLDVGASQASSLPGGNATLRQRARRLPELR